MPFITYPQESGCVAVVIPTGDVQDAIKDVPAGLPYKIVESLEIEDSYFDAYEFNEDTGLKVNISKAQLIHLDKFRQARAPKLAALDVEFMRAVETSNEVKQADIATKKQELRDVTKIELPDTLEEIKAVWPSTLDPRPSTQP